ncbi:MAG: site-specific integrase [Patescibacteria group bacterium]
MPEKTADITEKFFEYLSDRKLSKKTYKNYRSDISHFSGWLILIVRRWGVMASDLNDTIPFISKKLATSYKNFLVKNNSATKTINRRLSTLRHLANFLLETQILDFDFMEEITNLSSSYEFEINPLLPKFEKHLNQEKASKNTVKNYVNDVKQFLSWLESKNSVSN